MSVTSDGKLLISRDPEPYEITFLLLGLLYGVACSVRYDLAATSIRLYPGVGGRVFLAVLALGSLAALVGIANRNLWGVRLEGSALTCLVLLGLAYLMWTPVSVGTRGLGLMLFLGLLLVVPGAWVAWRLRRYLKLAERARPAGERPGGDDARDATE